MIHVVRVKWETVGTTAEGAKVQIEVCGRCRSHDIEFPTLDGFGRCKSCNATLSREDVANY